jgi:hypothetical protein
LNEEERNGGSSGSGRLEAPESLSLAVQLKNQLQQLMDEHGVDGYTEKWVNHEFPLSEYQTLNRLIKKAK